MIDDWPYIQKEAAKLQDRFGPHSLVQFLAGLNRAMADPGAPLQVEDLRWALDLAVQKAADRARYVRDREEGPGGLSRFAWGGGAGVARDVEALTLVTATLMKHHPSFDPGLFDRWKITRRDEDTVFYFGQSIRYVPAGGSYRYEICLFAPTMCLEEALAKGGETIEGSVVTAGTRLSNPDADDNLRCDVGDSEFFVPSSASKMAAGLVFDAVRRSGELGDLEGEDLPEDTTMTIRDRGDHFNVELLSSSRESFFSVTKASGEVTDVRHHHLEPDPEAVPEPDEGGHGSWGQAGSLAPAFNAGLVVGIILYFAVLYPLVGALTPGWRWVALGLGVPLFWALGVDLMLGSHPGRVTAVLAVAVAGAWIARWAAAVAWLPAAVVLVGALVGVGVGIRWRPESKNPSG